MVADTTKNQDRSPWRVRCSCDDCSIGSADNHRARTVRIAARGNTTDGRKESVHKVMMDEVPHPTKTVDGMSTKG